MTTGDMQLAFKLRAPRRRFCPSLHCSVPCGLGIGVTCSCRPCTCARCSAPPQSRPRVTVDAFPLGAAQARPLFSTRPTPTKETA